jgi:hypothetical protein
MLDKAVGTAKAQRRQGIAKQINVKTNVSAVI